MRQAELATLRANRREEEAAYYREQEKQRKKREMEENTAKLVAAAFDCGRADVEKILATGVPVDARNRRGVTALSEASCGGDTEVVSMLLKRRSDPNLLCEFGRSCLWRASYQGHEETVSLLLRGGADPRLGSC